VVATREEEARADHSPSLLNRQPTGTIDKIHQKAELWRIVR
jgi:hypothetical protein